LKANAKVKAGGVVALAFVFMTCLAAFPRSADAEVVDRIVAVVNNDVITQIQLDRAISARSKNSSAIKGGQLDTEAKQQTLDRLINDRLINQLMAVSKVEVTEDDLARAIANVLRQNSMSIDQLRAEVSAKGMSYDDYKKEVEREIRRIKFINQVIGPQVKITDQDLRDYFQRNQDRFRGSTRAHISQIFLPFEGITTEEEAQKLKDTALSIVAKGQHGGNFSDLARQYSKGPNAENGGDLGMVNLKDLPAPVADAVRALKVGGVTYPIPTENGLVIAKLVSLPELDPSDFESLRDRIYSALYDERIDETLGAYLQKERQKAFIEIR